MCCSCRCVIVLLPAADMAELHVDIDGVHRVAACTGPEVECSQWGIFLFFGGMVVLATVTVYFFYPETKGLSMEDAPNVFKDHWYWSRYAGRPNRLRETVCLLGIIDLVCEASPACTQPVHMHVVRMADMHGAGRACGRLSAHAGTAGHTAVHAQRWHPCAKWLARERLSQERGGA